MQETSSSYTTCWGLQILPSSTNVRAFQINKVLCFLLKEKKKGRREGEKEGGKDVGGNFSF